MGTDMVETPLTPEQLRGLVRTVSDWPVDRVQFRDITTLLSDPAGLQSTVHHLARMARQTGASKIAGMEARGFIFGAAVAVELGAGFVPVRKPGKLPVETIGIDYALEYGGDRLELDPGAIRPGENVLIIDDLIATGGTALAAAQLLRQAGATVSKAMFVIDLPELGGADQLREADIEVEALMEFDGE